MHICVSKLTIIGSDNGLSPGRCQAIIWTNAGILLIGPLGTNFSEILIEIISFSFKKMHLNVSSAKRRPFCLSLNVLISIGYIDRDALGRFALRRNCIKSWLRKYILFVIWWHIDTISPLVALCAGKPLVSVDSQPHKGSDVIALQVSFWLGWISFWTNSGVACEMKYLNYSSHHPYWTWKRIISDSLHKKLLIMYFLR